MSDALFDASDGNTPIDADEAHGLRLSWVRTRGDLNEAEASNIASARQAIRPPSLDEVLDDLWLRRLHERMFGEVWSWAGTYRLTERNIGIDPTEISGAVRVLVENCRVRIASEDADVAAARFHHRLVAIHPFPNGNGRHSRAATDYLCRALNSTPPTWGSNTFEEATELRAVYVRALRTADRDSEDLDALVTFMWS